MDNQEAKLILTTYRSGGEDASDPFFAEALDQVRHDPELGEWFADQRRFDQSMQSALQSTLPPVDLRNDLLINRRVVRLNQDPGLWERLQSRRAPWLALAASILLLLGIGLLVFPQSAPLTSNRLVQEIFNLKQNDKITLGKMGGGTDELRAWLANRGSPADFTVPTGLKTLGSMGCQTFTIDGHKVSLVCFMLDKDRVVHFFVMDSNGIDHPPGPAPAFIQRGGLTAATWSAGGRTYVLTGKDVDEETLRRLI